MDKIFSIDSSKEPWLQKALKESSLEKRDLFCEYAFWILEEFVFPSIYYFCESRKDVFFYFNRISGEFKYSFEPIPKRIMDVHDCGKTYDFLYVPLKARFLYFFYNEDTADRIFRRIVLEDPCYKKVFVGDVVFKYSRDAKEDLKDFLDGRRRRRRRRRKA